MSAIRNTRERYDQYPFTKEKNKPNPYYDGLLGEVDKRLMKEWDYITGAIESFFDNLDVAEENFDDISGFNASALTKDGAMESEVASAFLKSILEWLKTERNEVVTSMLENMDEDEYKANYVKEFGEEP